MCLKALRGGVQHYAWGSPTLMAERFGWPVTEEPQAELWVGAHPLLPASVRDGDGWSPLDDAIASDPVAWLGAAVVDRFGPTLPMLLKILGIGQPLSLQVHPSTAQAVAGFAREEAAGIDRFTPERLYRDERAKPELLCALTSMDVLCGFRALDEIRELFRLIGGPFDHLASLVNGDDSLRSIVTECLSRSADQQRALVDVLVEHVPVLPWSDGAVVGELAARYPGDAGVVVALLLNHMHLEAGDALFLPAGNLHAYLSGLGVEVMANSDNVLRGGLTPKHVDVAELARTLVPTSGPWPLAPSVVTDGVERWATSAPEVDLSKARIVGGHVGFPVSDGPCLFLVTDGMVTMHVRDDVIQVAPGEAAYAMPGSDVHVSGTGTVFRAAVNLAV